MSVPDNFDIGAFVHEAADVLAQVVRDHGTRGGDDDALLPIEQQPDPMIAQAMTALRALGLNL